MDSTPQIPASSDDLSALLGYKTFNQAKILYLRDLLYGAPYPMIPKLSVLVAAYNKVMKNPNLYSEDHKLQLIHDMRDKWRKKLRTTSIDPQNTPLPEYAVTSAFHGKSITTGSITTNLKHLGCNFLRSFETPLPGSVKVSSTDLILNKFHSENPEDKNKFPDEADVEPISLSKAAELKTYMLNLVKVR